MTHREALKKYIDIMKTTEDEVIPEAVRQAQAQQQVQAVCAHLLVGYVHQHIGAGKERGWWQCIGCDAKFVPAGTIVAYNSLSRTEEWAAGLQATK